MSIKIETFRDGGTQHIITDFGSYYIDGRAESKQRNKLYDSYPSDDKHPLPKEKAKTIKKQLLKSCKELGMQSYLYSEYIKIIGGILV